MLDLDGSEWIEVAFPEEPDDGHGSDVAARTPVRPDLASSGDVSRPDRDSAASGGHDLPVMGVLGVYVLWALVGIAPLVIAIVWLLISAPFRVTGQLVRKRRDGQYWRIVQKRGYLAADWPRIAPPGSVRSASSEWDLPIGIKLPEPGPPVATAWGQSLVWDPQRLTWVRARRRPSKSRGRADDLHSDDGAAIPAS